MSADGVPAVAGSFEVPGSGAVSSLLVRPDGARLGYVLAHGEVRGVYRKRSLPTYGVFDEDRYFAPGRDLMLLRFGEVLVGPTVCEDLWQRGVATLRWQFPYMEAKKGRPDPPAVAVAAVRAAVGAAAAALPGLPLVAGGKSFGGRMTSTAASEAPLEGVRGLAFLGYPLHPPGKPRSTSRA